MRPIRPAVPFLRHHHSACVHAEIGGNLHAVSYTGIVHPVLQWIRRVNPWDAVRSEIVDENGTPGPHLSRRPLHASEVYRVMR